ncbi:MFS transporter [Planctomycetota bacterium]
MDRKTTIFQWSQLLSLAVIHVMMGTFAGILPVILPRVREEFALSLSAVTIILATMNLVNNGTQLMIGHLRDDKSRPLLMQIGLCIAIAICAMNLLKGLPHSYLLLIVMAAVTGFGIAIMFPEILRAVHALDGISPSVSSGVFMIGGNIGFTVGAWLATLLVTRFGLQGLYFFLLAPVISLTLIKSLKIRLAIESKSNDTDSSDSPGLSIWWVYAATVPYGIALLVILSLLPTWLNELGYELTYGGQAVMIFGLGSVVGTLFWAAIAMKKGELITTVVAIFLGLPVLCCYFVFIEHRWAVWILFVAGLIPGSLFPLFITMARRSGGLKLGQRMGLIIGGVWGIASIFLMAAGYLAEYIGIGKLIMFSPAGLLISAAVCIVIMKKQRCRKSS